MLLNLIKVEEKEELIVQKYNELIEANVSPAEILVLVQNSMQKNAVYDKILKNIKINSFEQMNIHSFSSLVYNALIDNWCFIENSIPSSKTFIQPNLVGLEISQFLLKDILKTHDVKGYNSKKSLLHQIFRRYSLIIQNNLSGNSVRERSKILKESFGEDAELIIKALMSKTLKYRSLDYLRQIPVFNYVCKNTDYLKNIKFLIMDDADEITPVCFELLKCLRPQLIDWLIFLDEKGSSRCGYLSADTSIENKLVKLFDEDIKNAENTGLSFQEENGDIIFSNILNSAEKSLNNFNLISLSKRAEIIDSAILAIQNLIKNNNISPSEISVITPLQDDMLKFTLKEKLNDCNLVFLSGSEKLIDNPLVKASVNLLKILNNIEISDMDLRCIFFDYVGIPFKYCNEIFDFYKKNKFFPEIHLTCYDDKYQNFLKVLQQAKLNREKPSKQVYNLFYNIVSFVNEKHLNKFNFFIKQLRDFESVFGGDGASERIADIINQAENSIIAENPIAKFDFKADDLIIATPQKIIDSKIKTEYQFWLDVSHSDWIKNDIGPLYNSWVFQADWNKNEYTIEDDIFLSKQKIARVLRKLFLLCKKHAYAYSSLFDSVGTENQGGIEKYLISAKPAEVSKPAYKIIPRDDQKAVLDYKNGTMAVSAVPGAGKTTILLALIMKIMEQNINPENIFVLTYMDSAARNFRERIKNMSPNNAHLPNISTIHGLALRIIKDNSNYERLGLDSDFEICDDTQRMQILKSISGKYTKSELDDFDRAISVLKLQGGNVEKATGDKKISRFIEFYKMYSNKLKESGLIDYDDILLYSVRLLEENSDILEYYQQICEYIIEDEAQDSSAIQQRLISLLSGKHKNLIRCGDINQAITTTFSNADVKGFREFIKNADKLVEMNCSQRCTQDVMNLANSTVLWGEKLLPDSFYHSMMKGVDGKNPVSKDAIYSKVFEKSFLEQNFVLKEIKNILTREKDATIGILLRNNFQVAHWTTFINNAGFKTITRSDSLGQKNVFVTVFSILKFLQTSFDNEVLAQTYETLSEFGFYKQRLQSEIRNSKVPFISLSPEIIKNDGLSQFLWDMQYWLNCSTMPLEELAIKIGLFYYTSDVEKSNVYLIATLIKKLNNNSKDFNSLLEKLDVLSKKSNLSGFKFFSEEDDSSLAKGKVQIMTLHKSKGDEFDYVFIPELTEKALSIDVSVAKIKSSTLFTEQVKALNPAYKPKTELELKEYSAEESLRLLYVAVTRAKKKLYITTSLKSKTLQGKEISQEPCVVFKALL